MGHPPSEDDQKLLAHGVVLADAIDAAPPKWVEAAVAHRAREGDEIEAASPAAARQARSELSARIRLLLAQDIDDQRTTPLA